MNQYISDFWPIRTERLQKNNRILSSGAASESLVVSSCNLKQVGELPVKPIAERAP